MKQAFLRFRIHEQDRDAMHFHWIADRMARHTETLRFTRALFDLLFITIPARGIIQQHLRPVYTGDFCRSNSMQFLSRLSNSFKIARVNQVRFSVRFVAAISQGFRTCSKLDAILLRQKLHRVAATKIACVNGPLESCHATYPETQETYTKQQLGVPKEGGGRSLEFLETGKRTPLKSSFQLMVPSLPRETCWENCLEFTTHWVWSHPQC